MTGNSIWFLIVQSDFMSKCVLLTLLSMSVVCWTVFIFKIIVHGIKRTNIKIALQSLSFTHNKEAFTTYAAQHPHTVAAYMIKKNDTFLKHTETYNYTQNEQFNNDIEQINDQSVEEVVNQEQSLISILSTCAVVSPLLGLFGTVWGLVHAFLAIAEFKNADITTVAPGIAEALITTLAGLIVAIPAQIMYNILLNRIRSFDAMVLTFSDRVCFVYKRTK